MKVCTYCFEEFDGEGNLCPECRKALEMEREDIQKRYPMDSNKRIRELRRMNADFGRSGF